MRRLAHINRGWMVLAALAAALAASSALHAATLPYNGSDLRLWLRADGTLNLDGAPNANRVIGWSDQTGEGGNTVAEDGVGPGGNRPLWVDNVINGLPVVRFNSGNRRIDGPAVLSAGSGARTILIVGSSTTTANKIMFDPNGQGSGNAGDRLFRVTPEIRTRYNNGNTTPGADTGSPDISVPTTPVIFGVRVPVVAGGATQADVEFFHNSATILSGAATNPGNLLDTGAAGYRFGTTSWEGDIAEVLVFDAALSAAEINKIGSHLAGKYGLTTSFTGGDVHWDNGSTDTSGAVDPPYPGDNLWSTASNWRANNSDPMNQFPNDTLGGSMDRVNISLHNVPTEPAANTVPANVEAGDDILVNSVRVGGNFGLGLGGDGILNVNGGTLTIADTGGVGTGGRLELGGTGNRSGMLNVNGGTLNVGLDIITGAGVGTGTSTINLEGGTLATGSTDITVDSFNINSFDGGGAVTYVRNGGTLTVNGALRLGGESSGDGNQKGNLTQSAGAVTVHGDLLFGGVASGNNEGGTYNLDGGTLTVNGDIIEGAGGSPNSSIDAAQLQVDGGTLIVGGNITVQRFSLGQDGGTNGSYAIPAGQSVETTGTLSVGSNGTGTLDVLAAGASLKTSNAYVGEGSNGDGTVTIDNNNTWEVTQFLRIGHNGTGVVELKSGLLDVKGASGSTKGLRLAETASGDGTLIIGTAAGSGTGGVTVNVSGGNTETADEGIGVITMYHGTFNQLTNNIIVGQIGSSNATFTLHDGLVDIQNQLRIGNNDSSTGLFEQFGGTVHVGKVLDLANAGAGPSGTYRMHGGTLNADADVRIGYVNSAAASALVEIIDGTVHVGGALRIADNGTDSSGTLLIGRPAMDTTPQIHIAKNLENGDNGTGVVTMYSGTVTWTANNNWIIGQTGTGQATFNMHGGLVDMVTNTTSNGILKANSGDGVVNMTGGTLWLQDLEGANNAAGSTVYNLEGGLIVIDDNLDYRNSGTDTVNLKGTTLDLTGGTIHYGNRTGTNAFHFTGGTLLNVGTFNGDLVQTDADAPSILAPGPAGGTGTMTINGNYDQQGGTLEINVASPTQNDLLIVNGDVDLAGELLVVFGYEPSEMDMWTILENDGTDDSGTFAGLPEGATFYMPTASRPLWITYEGGDGNDIVLATVPEPATMALLGLAACGLGGYLRRRRAA